MKVAVFGDKLVKNELYEKALRSNLDFIDNLEIVGKQLDWPNIPLQNSSEVKEFVGSEEEIIPFVKDADIFITNVAPITEKILASSTRLKIIGCSRGGPVNINIAAATRRCIPVLYTPGRNAPVVAEYTVGMILAELFNIARAHASLMQGVWRGDFYIYENTGFELEGKTAGIIGLGAIGKRVAKLLKSFGMKVVAYDPYMPDEVFIECGAKKVSLKTLLQEADIVTIHARQTPETYKMINKQTINLMKPTAYLINTARGGVVDYEALYQALKEKRIAGAALDVFDEEPVPPDSMLFSLDNVTVTPHIGGASKETAYRSADILVREIKKLLLKEPVLYCKNPEVLACFSI